MKDKNIGVLGKKVFLLIHTYFYINMQFTLVKN